MTSDDERVIQAEPVEVVEGPTVMDPCLGFPGPAEPLPEGDADQDEPTLVNEDEDEVELDG